MIKYQSKYYSKLLCFSVFLLMCSTTINVFAVQSAKRSKGAKPPIAKPTPAPSTQSTTKTTVQPKSNSPKFAVQKTNIKVESTGRIALGDGIIVYGNDALYGIDYIMPGDTAGRGIPNSDTLSSGEFVVCGKKIVAANNQFQVVVYDTESKKMSVIPESEIRLAGMSNQMYGAQSIVADGNFCVVKNTFDIVTDRSAVKLIDVSGSEPKTVALDVKDTRRKIRQVAVDAQTKQVVVLLEAGNDIYVFDIDNPSTPSKMYKVSDNDYPNSTPIKMQGGYLFYISGESTNHFCRLDLKDGKVTKFTTPSNEFPFAINGGTYCYFVARDAYDSSTTEGRAAVGQIWSEPNVAGGTGVMVNGHTNSDGYIGFGSSAAITPDGKTVFIAGQSAVSDVEHLQVYNGKTFELIPDSAAKPPYLLASHVVINGSIVAFKIGEQTNTTLGYIQLKN